MSDYIKRKDALDNIIINYEISANDCCRMLCDCLYKMTKHMIPAADAIEELQKDLERSKDFEAFWQHEAEEALKKFQVAISNKPRWIPVTERLPEDGVFVLVSNDDGIIMVAKYETDLLGWYKRYCPYDYDCWWENEDGRITHWMPLPEPPEKEDIFYHNECEKKELQKRKRGEWIRSVDELGEAWMCSECMEEFFPANGMEEFIDYVHYCPNCGARMDCDS